MFFVDVFDKLFNLIEKCLVLVDNKQEENVVLYAHIHCESPTRRNASQARRDQDETVGLVGQASQHQHLQTPRH